MSEIDRIIDRSGVVPLVGTWIETEAFCIADMILSVVPLVGTWIETGVSADPILGSIRRSPCGNVD